MKRIFIALVIAISITAGVLFFTKYERTVEDILIEDIYINDMGIQNDTFYYEKLDEKQKKYYRVIANGVMNLDESITIEVTKEKEYDLYKNNVEIALTAFLADHPEVFFVNDRYEITLIDGVVIKVLKLKLQYTSNNKSEINEMEEALKNEIINISEKAKNSYGEYAKEEFIHDYLATNIAYYNYTNYEDIPTIKHTAYAALVDKSAVCDGITKAFQLLLAHNGIDTIFVTGSTEGVAHAWCKVKIDGDYYNVDVTSDKTLNDQNRNLVIHSYFNVTDAELLKTHTIDKNDTLPQCIATKYNYYTYNDYVIEPIDSFEYKLSDIIKKQTGKALLEVNVNGVTDATENLITTLYNLDFNKYKTNNVTKVQYNKVNDNYIIIK